MAFDKKTKEELRQLQERTAVKEEEDTSEAEGNGVAAAEEVNPQAAPVTTEEEEHDISEVFDDMVSLNGPSWILIAALLIILYPIGIFLIIVKVNRELENMKKNSRIVLGTGIGLILIGVIFAALASLGVIHAQKESDLLGSSLFLLVITCIGGAILIRKGIKNGRLADMNAKYKPVILDTPDGSVDAIAEKCGESYEECYGNLKALILAGFIPSAKLKKSTRSLVVRKYQY